MSRDEIMCPTCLKPAVKWFEFGGRQEPGGYYHCDECDRSCSVRYGTRGRAPQRSAWIVDKRTPEAFVRPA